MIETTIWQVQENCPAGEWDDLLSGREGKLNSMPHSVVLESSFMEMDSANAWLGRSAGCRKSFWDFVFYYKEGYDYGYVEYFFLEEAHLLSFRKEVPNFFGVWPDGQKFKTIGGEVYLDLD